MVISFSSFIFFFIFPHSIPSPFNLLPPLSYQPHSSSSYLTKEPRLLHPSRYVPIPRNHQTRAVSLSGWPVDSSSAGGGYGGKGKEARYVIGLLWAAGEGWVIMYGIESFMNVVPEMLRNICVVDQMRSVSDENYVGDH